MKKGKALLLTLVCIYAPFAWVLISGPIGLFLLFDMPGSVPAVLLRNKIGIDSPYNLYLHYSISITVLFILTLFLLIRKGGITAIISGITAFLLMVYFAIESFGST
ncbi:MAG: hypothetical protein WC047_06035 [Kiritimatiellales bacterium]